MSLWKEAQMIELFAITAANFGARNITLPMISRSSLISVFKVKHTILFFHSMRISHEILRIKLNSTKTYENNNLKTDGPWVLWAASSGCSWAGGSSKLFYLHRSIQVQCTWWAIVSKDPEYILCFWRECSNDKTYTKNNCCRMKHKVCQVWFSGALSKTFLSVSCRVAIVVGRSGWAASPPSIPSSRSITGILEAAVAVIVQGVVYCEMHNMQ